MIDTSLALVPAVLVIAGCGLHTVPILILTAVTGGTLSLGMM